jgi:hypothetical protein
LLFTVKLQEGWFACILPVTAPMLANRPESIMAASISRQFPGRFTWFLLLAVVSIAGAAEDVEKTIFLVNEADRVVAVNAETGQFFDLVLSAKERVEERHVANSVAILVTNQRFAGVSNYPSGWGTRRRRAGETVVSTEVAGYSALVVTSDRILVFNGKSGSWAEKRR